MKLTIFLEEGLDDKERNVIGEILHGTYLIDFDYEYLAEKFVSNFLDKRRNQIRGDLLLEALSRKRKGFLAIITEDLFVPNLNFIFGVAIPNIGAVVSTYRLWLDADLDTFAMRLQKTIKHELGHFFGLLHCVNNCVMRFSNSLFELDLKPSVYCNVCKRKLKEIGVINDS